MSYIEIDYGDRSLLGRFIVISMACYFYPVCQKTIFNNSNKIIAEKPILEIISGDEIDIKQLNNEYPIHNI